MAKAKKSKDYFGLSWIVSLILVIIPVTSWILGAITRFKEGHIICGIIRLIGGWIIWVLDLITFILKGRIFRITK